MLLILEKDNLVATT